MKPKVRALKLYHMVDGGIRSGTDIVIALRYRAEAVALGRVIAAGIGLSGHPAPAIRGHQENEAIWSIAFNTQY